MTEAQTPQASITTVLVSTLGKRVSTSTVDPRSLLSRHHKETAVSVVEYYMVKSHATPPSIDTGLVDEDLLWVEHSRFGQCSLRFHRPLELRPKYDATTGIYTLEYEPLEILVFSRSRKGLRHELDRQLCLLWEEYACEDDSNLTPGARDLKQRVLAHLEEDGLAEEQEDG